MLSLGGGVQSTALALMSVRGEFQRPDVVVFADTGNESRATYQHLAKLRREIEAAGIEFARVSAGNIAEDVLRAAHTQNGARDFFRRQPPFYVQGDDREGRLQRMCSGEYKIEPMIQFVRARLGLSKGQRIPRGVTVEKWLGITTDEASRMKPSRHNWVLTRWPLIEMDMTRWDCHIYLKKAGWGVVPKSACLICPFHDNAYWRELRDTQPDEWREVVQFEKQLHAGRLPGCKSRAYLHRSCVPLEDVDLTTDADRGQLTLTLWAGECEGICGT